jgi:hypothetical protein
LALLMWGETGTGGAVDLAGKRRRTATGAHERLLEMRKMSCTNRRQIPSWRRRDAYLT